MSFLSCAIPIGDEGDWSPNEISGVVTRLRPGARPGEAPATQTLVACNRELRPLTGADAHGGLELGPPLQLFADAAARDGEPAAAARRPYEPRGLLRGPPAWDACTCAVHLVEGHAIVRLVANNTVAVVAGDVEAAGDADGRGGSARFRSPRHLASDGAGAVYVAQGRRVRKLQLPGGGRGPGAAQEGPQPATAGVGPAAAAPAALAAAGDPAGGTPGDQAAAGEVLVSTLPFEAPSRIRGLAFDGASSSSSSSSGSLLLATATALYRLPLGDAADFPLTLLAGSPGEYAQFRSINGLVLDGEGSAYVADWAAGLTTSLRRVAAGGAVTTVVGGLQGYLGRPAILPNGCLAVSGFSLGGLRVLRLGLKLPAWHAAAAPLSPAAAPAGPPPRTLPADLRALLDRQPDGTADVTIVVGGRTFHAHRALLSARSDYFQQRFGGGFAEGSAQQLSLPDADPDAFEVVLCWVYSGAADISAALAAGVAKLADRLLLPELREQAAVMVEASVSAVAAVDAHAAVMREAEAEVKPLASQDPGVLPQPERELLPELSPRPSRRARTD